MSEGICAKCGKDVSSGYIVHKNVQYHYTCFAKILETSQRYPITTDPTSDIDIYTLAIEVATVKQQVEELKNNKALTLLMSLTTMDQFEEAARLYCARIEMPPDELIFDALTLEVSLPRWQRIRDDMMATHWKMQAMAEVAAKTVGRRRDKENCQAPPAVSSG